MDNTVPEYTRLEQLHKNNDKTQNRFKLQSEKITKESDKINLDVSKRKKLPETATNTQGSQNEILGNSTNQFDKIDANTLITQMSRMVKLQAAHDVEIDVFTGVH